MKTVSFPLGQAVLFLAVHGQEPDQPTLHSGQTGSKLHSTVPHVVTLDGWQAYCGNYSPQMSLPSTKLPELCLQACQSIPDCKYVTLDYADNRCWFLSAHNNCKFIRNGTRSTLADVTKDFVMQEETDYYGFDLKFGDAFAVPEQVVTIADCVKLCQVHPLCNVVGWDYHVPEEPRCYLKNIPQDGSSYALPKTAMTSVLFPNKPGPVPTASDSVSDLKPTASQVATLDGWQAYCGDYSPQMSLPSTKLPKLCLQACRTIPDCKYITLDYADNRCWFLSTYNDCKFIRNRTRSTLADVRKEFVMQQNTDYFGFDLRSANWFIVADERPVPLGECLELCRIHPGCNAVSWDNRPARAGPWCFLKNVPQDVSSYASPAAGVISFYTMPVNPAAQPGLVLAANELTGIDSDASGTTDDHSITSQDILNPSTFVHRVSGMFIKSLMLPSQVITADGWQAYCDDPSPQLSVPSTELAQLCLYACRTIPYCEYITLDFSDKRCWFLSQFNQCKFVRSPSRSTIVNATKEFGMADDMDFDGYDILYDGSMIVPERSVALDDCVKLCQIHPFCTAASWDNRAPDDPRCYLKQIPHDPSPWTFGTFKFGVISLWVVTPVVADEASPSLAETTTLKNDAAKSRDRKYYHPNSCEWLASAFKLPIDNFCKRH